MEKLKPCPHCGGEAELFRVLKPTDDYLKDDCYVRVQCSACGASGMEVFVDDDPCGKEGGWETQDCVEASSKAIMAWNLRRADSEYEGLMKQVLQAVADLKKLCHPEEEMKDDSVATSQR